MDSTDISVLRAVADWQSSAIPVILVTLVETWGSAPRPVGSLLAISADGRIAGSVSGGCIEDDLMQRVVELNRTGWPALPFKTSYGVSAEEARKFGLPCGGTLGLLMEPIHADSQIADLLDAIQTRQVVRRQLELASGAVTLSPAQQQDGFHLDAHTLQTVHGPKMRLLVIGAGQVAAYLDEMAAALDIQVLICDPREEYQRSWTRPSTPIDSRMPDDFVLELKPDRRTAIVALTHDPKQDDLALIEALRSEALYVGALGSRSNQEKRKARLKEFDLTDAQLARLKGPVGLPIGSRSPPELAIAILADVIAVRNGIHLQAVQPSCNTLSTIG
jgi:xanthine dehydrogenase accessory factor